MLSSRLPTDADDLTVADLNAVLAATAPGVSLVDFAVTESHLWGSGAASSAGRLVIEPQYTPGGAADLPRRLVVKVAKTDPQSDDPKQVRGTGALYRNEVDVYTRLRPADFLEAPRIFGAVYDPDTSTFLLVMEDLRDRGATFGAATLPVEVESIRSLIGQLSTLHARYWMGSGLAHPDWMEAHTRGDLHRIFNTPEAAPRFIAEQVANVQFKREMVQRLGTTVEGLHAGFQRVQRHQAALPQTICHGDTHIGNTYILPDGGGGLLDWQLTCTGYAMHDISYLIATGLSVADRRRYERDLLAEYREQLASKGVKDAPKLDELWLEYGRALVWGVYIGWLTTPVVNYGWEINVINHLRLMTAYEDLETGRLIQMLG